MTPPRAPSFELLPTTKAILALSYHTGLELSGLLELEAPLLDYYLEMMQAEADENKR